MTGIIIIMVTSKNIYPGGPQLIAKAKKLLLVWAKLILRVVVAGSLNGRRDTILED